jgi:hypothetical protein
LAQFFLDQTSGASLKGRVQRFDETANNIVAGIKDPGVKSAASKALAAAVGEMKTATDVVNSAVEEIESLFDSNMRRVEGWYKKITQNYTLALSIVFAILINADSIYIGQRLWLDDDLRAQTVAAAEAFYKNEEAQDLMFKSCAEPDAKGQSGTDTAEPAPNPGQPSVQDKALKELECAKLRFDAAMEASVESAGFPLGWRMRQGWFHQDQSIILAVFGWVLTGLALSLGSSFWFDLLGKFMKVRQSGARESSEPQNPPQEGKTQ